MAIIWENASATPEQAIPVISSMQMTLSHAQAVGSFAIVSFTAKREGFWNTPPPAGATQMNGFNLRGAT